MSAFICSPKTLNIIYSGLLKYNDVIAQDTVTQLYKRNVESVNCRYRENTNTALPPETRFFLQDVTLAQLIKSLECLMYQMSEGDVPETHEYAYLERLIQSLYALPEVKQPDFRKAYQEAEWD
jgi:hypothetical protein